MNAMRKAWSYARLSTDAQMRGVGLQRQLDASSVYAEANGFQLVESLQDIGLSGYTGANVAGGQLGRFLELVRAEQVEHGSALIIENIDRLSRQAVFKSLSLLVELVNAGVEVHTLGDGRIFNTGTSVGDLIVSLIGMERSYNESQTKSLKIGIPGSEGGRTRILGR